MNMHEYDFFDTPITPYTVLANRAEVEIHIRDTETMEQRGVRALVATSPEQLPDGERAKLNIYGRLGERIRQDWYIHILDELEEDQLATDHEMAQKLDIEQSQGADEKFKESRYRKKKED
jgi:hypothetical protein